MGQLTCAHMCPATRSQQALAPSGADAQHRQMREGGEEVVVRVQPSSRSMGDTFMASVEDNNNGIYTATYTAPAKGNYMVSVEVNGLPISGSPFPVFFSAPVDPAVLAQQEEEAKAAAAAAAPPPQGGKGRTAGAKHVVLACVRCSTYSCPFFLHGGDSRARMGMVLACGLSLGVGV
eukprot:360150-Pelagomonas_calceolata.AAC.4